MRESPSTESVPQDTGEQTPVEKQEKPSAKDAPKAPGRAGRVLAWIALVLLGGFVCVQLAGLLLRDRLERRRPLLAHAPAAAPSAAPVHETPAGPEPSRFGPEIQEVAVARGAPASSQPPTEAPPAPAPEPHAAPQAPLTASATQANPPVAVVATPKPSTPPATAPSPKAVTHAPPSAAPTGPPIATKSSASLAPAPEKGTHALLVDVFLGQQYLKETEQRMKALGVPSFRTEMVREGPGFKVTVAAGTDLAKARKALDAAGLIHKVTGTAVEAYFLYRREAQGVMETLSAQGFLASAAAVQGERPYWKLYAGPFSEDGAGKAKQKLAAAGLKTTLEARP